MRHQHPTHPDLSADDWHVVADALRDGWSVPDTSVFATLAARLRSLAGIDAVPVPGIDPRTRLLHDFLERTRRDRRPAKDLADALIANGFSDRQVAALAMLSIH